MKCFNVFLNCEIKYQELWNLMDSCLFFYFIWEPLNSNQLEVETLQLFVIFKNINYFFFNKSIFLTIL